MTEASYKKYNFIFGILIFIAIVLVIIGLCYLFPSESCGSMNTTEGSSTQASPDGTSCQDPTSTGWWLIAFGVVFFIIAGVYQTRRNKSQYLTLEEKTTTTKTPVPSKTVTVEVLPESTTDRL